MPKQKTQSCAECKFGEFDHYKGLGTFRCGCGKDVVTSGCLITSDNKGEAILALVKHTEQMNKGCEHFEEKS